MTTFEVTIESAESKPLRLLVAADNWVAAWQEGLRVIGVDELPADSQCVVGHEGRVSIDIPTLGRQFTLVQVHDLKGQRPQIGRPLLLADDDSGGAKIQLHATHHPKLFRKPLSRAPRRDDERGAEPAVARRPTAPGLSHRGPGDNGNNGHHGPPREEPARPTTPDPIARVLSELERQRLLSRPVRISSQTGLPTHDMSGRTTRREPTPNAVPRIPTTDERKRPRERTQAFAAIPSDQLPQQFHPVHDEAPRETWDESMQWAAETAWQHVPCAMAMVVSFDEDDALAEVIAARGERERESRGCRVANDAGPTHVGRAPSLARFPAERPVRFHRADSSTWDLPVTSVLSVPVERGDGELTGLGLVLVNAARATGFTDSELRAVSYLARTLAGRI